MKIDDNLVEQMLDGSVDPDDLPTELVAVASVLRAAAAPPRADEQRPGPGEIREIFEQARRPPAVPGTARRERPAPRRWKVGAAVAAVVAGVTFGGSAALAASGNLPAPAQSVAHEMFAVVGVDVPDAPEAGSDPADAPVPTGGQTSSTDVPPMSMPTTAPTTQTTPTAPTAPTVAPTPTTDVAGVPGRGDEVCQEASDGRCQAGEHGKAGDDHPSVTRPSVTEPGPPTTDVPSPSVPDNPSATRPDTPSATAPGQTGEKDKGAGAKGQDAQP